MCRFRGFGTRKLRAKSLTFHPTLISDETVASTMKIEKHTKRSVCTRVSPGRCGQGVSPVPVQMWAGGEPGPGADVARGEPSPGADVGRG